MADTADAPSRCDLALPCLASVSIAKKHAIPKRVMPLVRREMFRKCHIEKYGLRQRWMILTISMVCYCTFEFRKS